MRNLKYVGKDKIPWTILQQHSDKNKTGKNTAFFGKIAFYIFYLLMGEHFLEKIMFTKFLFCFLEKHFFRKL